MLPLGPTIPAPIDAVTLKPMAYGLTSQDFFSTTTYAGRALLSRDSTSYTIGPGYNLSTPPGVTYIVGVTVLVSETDGTAFVSAFDSSWNIGHIHLGDGTNPVFRASFWNGSITQYITASSNYVIGRRYVLCVQSNAATTAFWIDGILIGQIASGAAQGNAAQTPYVQSTGTNGAFALDAYMGWKYMIPAAQVVALSSNTNQVFAPATRRWYLGSGAGSYFASWADTLTATESLAGLSAYTATVPDTLTATEAYSDVYSGGLTPSKKSVKWASQPRSSSAADTSDPLTQGLSFLSKFGNGGYDKNGGYDNAVSGSRYYFSPSGGAPGIAVGSEGMGIASSSAAMYYQGSSALFSTTGTGDFTMLFRAVLTASAGHNPIISDVAGTQLLAVGPSGGTYDNVSTLTGPDVTVGKPFTCVWTRKAGTAYIYIDNAVTSGASSASFPSTTSTVLLGDTSTYYFTGLLYQVAIWSNRGMAPVEARQLIAAPWRLYAPLVRRFYWTPGLGTFYGTVADTPSVADALTGLSAYTGTVPDTLTLTDNTSGVPAFLASLPDTLTSTDVLNAAAAFSALVAETATITDSDSGVWGFVRSWADTPTLSDAISALGTFLATLADTLASVDVYSTGALGNLQDTLAASESLTAVGTFLAALADTPSLADLFGGSSTLSAILAETLAATDAYQAAAAFLATYAESLTVTDGTFGAGSGAITDTLSAIDSYPVVAAAFKTLTDTLSASDAYYLAGLLVGNSKYVRAAAVRNYTRVGAPRNYTKIATNH